MLVNVKVKEKWKAESGRRKAEGGKRKAEGGERNAECGMRKAEMGRWVEKKLIQP